MYILTPKYNANTNSDIEESYSSQVYKYFQKYRKLFTTLLPSN